MNILVIITGLGMGGAERQVIDLVERFSVLGHRVLLVTMTGDIVITPPSKMVDVVSLNMTKSPQGIIRAYFKIRSLIKCFQPDIVHSHMVHANIFSRLVRLTVTVPKLICTAHSSNEGGLGRMIAYRLTDSLCELTTNVSEDAVSAFIAKKAVPKNRILAVHNGVDTKKFVFDLGNRIRLRSELKLTDDMVLILAVGRLDVAKDYPNLLHSFKLLCSTGRDVNLAIIGYGDQYSSLVNVVTELGLESKVHFLGLRHNVHEWMSAADVFVLSSAWEGFGLVVAEAMACKRIVVATDCGGVREVVNDCGILVPPKDHVALANGIEQVLCMDANDIETLGLVARNRVECHYSLNAQAERWLSLYK
ncbi:glycosyltransferase [Aeromonas caviae]|uniref:glycosyltransferase n=1 Tax=Aeromonas caviae TaxID=648 RepID=UPI0038D106C2